MFQLWYMFSLGLYTYIILTWPKLFALHTMCVHFTYLHINIFAFGKSVLYILLYTHTHTFNPIVTGMCWIEPIGCIFLSRILFFFALIGSNIYGCHLGYSRNTHRNTFTEFASQIVQHFGSEQGDDRKNFFTANDDIRYSCTHFYSRVCFVCHHLMYSILFIV